MSRYEKEKQRVRNMAIDWQNNFNNYDYSYSELCYFNSRFTELGKRFGLLKEFRENGII